MKKFIIYSANLFQLLWILILWTPFVFTIYNSKPINELYGQLTWWSWTIQCFFYTFMHLKKSPFYKKIRNEIKYPLIIQKFNKKFPNIEIYVFGIVSGIAWFVFLEFMYVLYHNPDLVCNEARLYNNKGIPQIGNIFIHYYIVTATPLWTLFNFRYLHAKLENLTEKESYIFCSSWILYVLCYIAYWKFNIIGILKNYHIDDVNLITTGLYLLSIIFGVVNINMIQYYCIVDKFNLCSQCEITEL